MDEMRFQNKVLSAVEFEVLAVLKLKCSVSNKMV
jgi:hypothetical protein